ncbi:MAG: polysaccharide biosynthesis/export family protein [Paludibacteraceae bacterium]|nr:polysaccharide biosynthesis/export family protein [Paludibacteraceae bacterium]
MVLINKIPFVKVLLCLLCFSLASCTAYKKVPYFQDAENETLQTSNPISEPELTFNDELTITVGTPTPEASAPFNLQATPSLLSGGNPNPTGGQGRLQTYQIDEEGNIDFPVLGKIHAEGLQRSQLEDLIKSRLYPGILTEEPVITIRRTNFKISVLGEVKNPGNFTITNDHISILEALAYAGDMTIYGKRDNVLVVREDAKGNKTTARLNLQNKDIVNSPYYYLKQNDVVYVTPNKHKGNTSAITSSETITFSIVSMLATLTYLIINVFNLN